MEVRLSAETVKKLSHLAIKQGTDSESLVQEAVERMVNYDAWFLAEVEKGLQQIERGETLTHRDAGDRLRAMLARKQAPRE
jgi:predicted transcriptional regulator